MSVCTRGKEQTGLADFVENTLSGDLRHRPAGRLMQRIIREHPKASTEEAMRLFRDAALDDPEVFEDVLTEVFKRDFPNFEEDRKD